MRVRSYDVLSVTSGRAQADRHRTKGRVANHRLQQEPHLTRAEMLEQLPHWPGWPGLRASASSRVCPLAGRIALVILLVEQINWMDRYHTLKDFISAYQRLPQLNDRGDEEHRHRVTTRWHCDQGRYRRLAEWVQLQGELGRSKLALEVEVWSTCLLSAVEC